MAYNYYQQPQNIYQQLGKPQPQPHLQSVPNYVQPPPQPQQVPQGFYNRTSPYAPSQTPYQPTQTPYLPPQTPYQHSYTPQPPPQTPYQPQLAQYPPQQQQPVVYAPQQHIPTSSYAIPANSSGSTWKVPVKPPPVSPSASLAQHVQHTRPPPQVQPQPQVQPSQPPPPTPQTPGRRPLPQPAPGVNAQTPVVPPKPNRKPFPSSTTPAAPPMTRSPSPTRNRPLPTPAGGGAGSDINHVVNVLGRQPSKRATVDLGKLPKIDTSTLPFVTSTSAPTTEDKSATSSSPSKGTSLTSTFAAAQPKRRPSPPRFHSQTSSESSSPVKDAIAGWEVSANPPSTSRENGTSSINSFPNSTSTTTTATTPATTTSTDPPKKFTPMWKRSIPDQPMPAIGYAVGMVKDPFPKPQPQAPAQPSKDAESAKGKEKEKDTEKEQGTFSKLLMGKGKKKDKGKEESAPPQPQPQPVKASAQYQPYPAPQYAPPSQYQQQTKPQPQYPPQHIRTPAEVIGQLMTSSEESEEEEEEEGEESTEESESARETASVEESEETGDEEEQHQYHRQHGRYPTHPPPSPSRAVYHPASPYREDQDLTPKKPKPKQQQPQPKTQKLSEIAYAGYESVKGRKSMAGAKGHAKWASWHAEQEYVEEEEEEEDYTPRKSGKPRQKQRRYEEEDEDEEEEERYSPSKRSQTGMKLVTGGRRAGGSPGHARPSASRMTMKASPNLKKTGKLVKGKGGVSPQEREYSQPPSTGKVNKLVAHIRSKSAFDEREREREPQKLYKRRTGSGFDVSPRTRRRYEEEEEKEDEEGARLAYERDEEEDDEEEEEEEDTRRRRSPTKKSVGVNVRDGRRQTHAAPPPESPQWGIRDLPRQGRGMSVPAKPYGYRHEQQHQEDSEEQEEQYLPSNARRVQRMQEVQYPTTPPPPLPERRGPAANSWSGLPQPPAIARDWSHHPNNDTRSPERKVAGGPRWKSQPIRYHDEVLSPPPSPGGFGGIRSESRGSMMSAGSAPSDTMTAPSSPMRAWPPDLPRLPRTPGSVTSSEGYFDVRTGRPSSVPPPPLHPQQQHRVYLQQHRLQLQQQRQQQQQQQQQQQRGVSPARTHGQGTGPFSPRLPQRHTLNLDDPPPRASVMRSPSPVDGRMMFIENSGARQSQYQHQELQHRQYNQQQLQQPQQPSSPRKQPQPLPPPVQYNQLIPNTPTRMRKQPQTPAPPPVLGIESPHPVGGRDKRPDIERMEDSSNDGMSDREGMIVPRIRVNQGINGSGNNTNRRNVPMVHVEESPRMGGGVPMIHVEESPRMGNPPMINIDNASNASGSPRKKPRELPPHPQQPPQQQQQQSPRKQVFEIPGVSVSGPEYSSVPHIAGPSINISGADEFDGHQQQQQQRQSQQPQQRGRPPAQFGPRSGGGGLMCGGCGNPIAGRIVSAMNTRWHPECFKCSVCDGLLEHVSAYEKDGRPYCHLDYHENFAPKCYSCKTSIIEERFISLDDPALGKRTYHTQHFFCAECGDPFLSPSASFPTNDDGELALADGEFEGFTVYKGYPYCEACHVNLRLPKCKRCKKSIREHDEAVEALGGKWCWRCFICNSCNKPFDDPSFFERDGQPYCEHCFSVMLRNEV